MGASSYTKKAIPVPLNETAIQPDIIKRTLTYMQRRTSRPGRHKAPSTGMYVPERIFNLINLQD